MKTARFASIVEAAGAPMPHPLWLAPEKDPGLQRAIKEHRVLTVHQDVRGSRKDYATVGFEREPDAQYLLFPKSLRRFQDRRVVGIDYSLLAQESSPTGKTAPLQVREEPARPSPARARRQSAKSRGNVVPFAPKRAEAATAKITPTSAKGAKPEPARATKAAAAEPGAPRKRETIRKTADPALLKQLRHVSSDLKAGKTVAAYERLQEVLRKLESGDG